jgi:hypothetical protein
MMLACATTERSFSGGTNPALGGSMAAVGGASVGGANVGGTKANGGALAVGGAATPGGQSSTGNNSAGGATTTVAALVTGGALTVGGASAADQSLAGSSSNGGANATGGAVAAGGVPNSGGVPAVGGQSANSSNNGGAIATGGAIASGGTPVVGGALATGGSQPVVDTGLGGNVATGGIGATGGANPTGGAPATGGAVGTGGSTSNCIPTAEICTDGIDNDCDGNIDCPVVSGRFPEPGRAAAGDDAWVQLNSPTLPIQAVQCRTGKPGQVGSQLWLPCTSSSPASLTLYSMDLAAANVPENNGVTKFEFRFLYTNGQVSNPSSIVYYAHNSLFDNVPGTPLMACTPLASDYSFFGAASNYLTGAASQPTFAPSDVQLKNPFISLTFLPSKISNGPLFSLADNDAPQRINVLSLRHRFLVDPSRQMLLVTRSYKARRETSQTCRAAIIEVRDTHTNAITNPKAFKNNKCDAIVLNKAGSGVCIEVVGGVPVIRGLHAPTILAFLQSLGIRWPNVDMTMWQKLFDDRPKRKTLLIFSDKCPTEDSTCFNDHPNALSLPDSGDPYFTGP